MKIFKKHSEILLSNTYVVEEKGHAIVIDPARDTSIAKGLVVDFIITTHEHYDHVSGVNIWKSEFHTQLLCSEKCAARITDPRKNLARYFEAICQIQTWVELKDIPIIDTNYCCYADAVFSGELFLDWQGHVLRLVEIPGHSPGSIGIFLDNEHFFSGDSLIKGTEIELRFPGGDECGWRDSGLPIINSIPTGVMVWPGHMDAFRIGEKKV